MFEFQAPHGDFGGYIFDCDGTLVDSMPAHYAAWTRALAEFEQADLFPEDEFYSMGGVPTADIVRQLNARHGLSLDPIAVTRRKEVIYDELATSVPVIQEVASFARTLAGIRPLSVASGGLRDVVVKTLRSAELIDLFPVIVAAEDVERGKPAPDCFLLAAHRMGVPPETCVVFEDSVKGMEAAHAAGMHAVFVKRLSVA